MPHPFLARARHAVLALCLLAAVDPLQAQSSGASEPAAAEPGSRPAPDSSRAPDGASTTRGQTDSNPDRPSASPGERAPRPAPDTDEGATAGQPPGPMPRGQGTVEPQRSDAMPQTQSPPAGRAGSGGHKHGYGR
jgi:hypothetical protein